MHKASRMAQEDTKKGSETTKCVGVSFGENMNFTVLLYVSGCRTQIILCVWGEFCLFLPLRYLISLEAHMQRITGEQVLSGKSGKKRNTMEVIWEKNPLQCKT